MKTTPVLNCIERELQLGTCIASPQRVSGGYLHKMYKIKTTAGTYALKLLNPVIMKRPDALGNYRRAEYFERILCEHHIPVVPALEINGKKMHCADGQYFYLFRWIEGRTLRWDEIRTGHCETIGALLSKIHQIEQIKKPYAGNPVCADWDSYIAAAKTQCPEIADELKSHRTLFYAGQEAFNAAIRNLPPITCISDGDMDCKNVLWRNHQPLLIDLECLDYGNPLLEMFQLALS